MVNQQHMQHQQLQQGQMQMGENHSMPGSNYHQESHLSPQMVRVKLN